MGVPMPRSSTILALALGTLGLVACSASPSERSGDTGDTEQGVTGTGACNRTKLLADASPARATAIRRGLAWFDANVPYSQTRSHGGYRTDCSGFVSMCWELGTSYTTENFADGSGEAERLGAISELLPGDALVRRAGGAGHMFLFAGWADAAHANACVIEERSTALGIQFHTRTTASIRSGSYHPIRADKLRNDTGAGAGAGSAPPDGGTTPSPSTGPACTSDGECNPGSDGAGLVCERGQCVPGCRTDAQCPGVKTCVSGSCG